MGVKLLVRKCFGEAEMVSLGEQLGQACLSGMVIYLKGDLGMGKTTLCRGVLQAFGHTGSVKSPTYTLVEPYQFDTRQVFHFDLYRLGEPEELEYMGIRDYFSQEDLCLIEWPEKGVGYLPVADMVIEISVLGRGRSVLLQAKTARGEQLINGLPAGGHSSIGE
jgi:tRNA threonylcarbamoyladenosine biosynthesis protein TsaE